jgi:hypothetical protein
MRLVIKLGIGPNELEIAEKTGFVLVLVTLDLFQDCAKVHRSFDDAVIIDETQAF